MSEPVAWMYNYNKFPDSFVVCRAKKSDQDIPLYTHPVKELTDEEIEEVALSNMEGVGRLIYMVQGNVKGGDFKEAIRSFAKAILRKAQEK